MASALNRTTKQYLTSVNTPDYPVADWIVDPDLSAVVGFPSIYWVITGDVVTLMTQVERDAVDATILEASRDALISEIDNVEDILRAFANVLLDELNAHSTKMAEISSIVDGAGNYSAFVTAMQGISDYPQRTLAQLRTAIRNKLGS